MVRGAGVRRTYAMCRAERPCKLVMLGFVCGTRARAMRWLCCLMANARRVSPVAVGKLKVAW